MDAVILAAGRGERVRDLAPEFHKPLLPIDGTPLVCRAVDLALEAGVHTPVVVVAPSNAEAISGALEDRSAQLIIQREPRGPGHALLVGLSVYPRGAHRAADRVLVLLSDNVVSRADVEAVSACETAIGTKKIERREAHRFTRFENNEWVEKKSIGKLDGSPFECWVGPLVVWRSNTVKALQLVCEEFDGSGEVLIGPYLRSFMTLGNHVLVPVSSFDVGTIESYRRYTSE